MLISPFDVYLNKREEIPYAQTDGLSDNLPPAHLPTLSSRLNALLDSPSNSHLSPLDRAEEKARLLADVLVGYGRMAMARTGNEDGGRGWKTPFEEAARREGYEFKGGKVDECVDGARSYMC